MENKQKPTTGELKEILAMLGLFGIDDGAIKAFTSDEDGSEYAVWLIDTEKEKHVLKPAQSSLSSILMHIWHLQGVS